MIENCSTVALIPVGNADISGHYHDVVIKQILTIIISLLLSEMEVNVLPLFTKTEENNNYCFSVVHS